MQEWRFEEYPAILEQHERNTLLYDADLVEWKKKGRSKGEPPPEKPERPRLERYIVSDITAEALADRLQDSPRGVLLAIDELAEWIAGFDAYRSGRGGDVGRWLSIFRAESLLVDRKTNKQTIFVKRAAVSIAGSIQPGTFKRILGIEHVENGLLARLLVAYPPRSAKQWTETIVDADLTQQVERMYGRLLALEFGRDANDTPAPVDLPLSVSGKAAWIEFYNRFACRQEDASGPLAAAYAKLEAYAARLALIDHLVRSAVGDSI